MGYSTASSTTPREQALDRITRITTTTSIGIGLHTPASVHYRTATEVRVQRAATLDAAYAANPARFRHQRPEPPKLPTIAWINEPTPEALIKSA